MKVKLLAKSIVRAVAYAGCLHHKSGGGFSPSSLFSGGFQGWWYDFSDMSTLFQDSAGSTPVTAVEQPIGRVLDKSGNGNHSIQATSSLKPTLSARSNIILKSEAFDDAAWIKQFCSVTANNVAGTAAIPLFDTITEDASAGNRHACYQNQAANIAATSTHTTSVYAKAGTRNFVWLGIGNSRLVSGYCNLTTGACTIFSSTDSANFTMSATDEGGGVWRVSLTGFHGAADALYVWVGCSDGVSQFYSGNGTGTVHVGGAQCVGGSVAGTYQYTNTATDYNTVGFPHYARFDGVDDFMQSASAIAWGSDKASVFTGITKNPVSSNAFWVDFGAKTVGSFDLGSINSTTPLQYIGARGSGSMWSAYVTASFNGNLPTYHSGLFDIAGATLNDAFKRRTNGTANTLIQNDAGPIGTGNFGTQTLRLSASVALHNGAMYQSVGVAKTASATEITNTESFISKKLGLS